MRTSRIYKSLLPVSALHRQWEDINNTSPAQNNPDTHTHTRLCTGEANKVPQAPADSCQEFSKGPSQTHAHTHKHRHRSKCTHTDTQHTHTHTHKYTHAHIHTVETCIL